VPGKAQGVNAFALELEDYLIGLTYLPNELVRAELIRAIAPRIANSIVVAAGH
jgi:hypothetical protein